MAIAIIFTNDWELYGNGSGDFYQLQQKPLAQLLEVTKDQGISFTVFAEMGQQIWGSRKHASEDPAQSKIAQAWDDALRRATYLGADVQCHLHPQWLSASLIRGRWLFSDPIYSSGEVSSALLRESLLLCKTYLENLLSPIRISYKCSCYRAGAFLIEPSNNLAEALADSGYLADSSVLPSSDTRRGSSWIKRSDSLGWWRFRDSIHQKVTGVDGLLEFPVSAYTSLQFPLLKKLLSPKLHFALFDRIHVEQEDVLWQETRNSEQLKRYPLNERSKYAAQNMIVKVRSMFPRRCSVPLDYDQMPPSLFLRSLRRIVKSSGADINNMVFPIVALGHSKGIVDANNFSRIVKALKREFSDEILFWSVTEAITYFQSVSGNKN